MFEPLEVIASESARFAELAATTPADTPIPSCPEWTARDLVAHLGEVQQFWAGNVRAARPDQATNTDTEPPESSELVEWMRASTEALLDALRQADADTPSWTWWDRPRTAGAVARHQVQEAAVHRWDAEAAVGAAGPLDAEVADDGVGEFLEIMVGHDADGLPGTVRLRSLDTGGEWSVGAGDAASPGDSHTATITATASDLVLLLYGRIPLDAVEVAGSRSLASGLLSILVTE
jgi:uncharacterized protein (TIGR03083 family)